jgi:hypothetical protein
MAPELGSWRWHPNLDPTIQRGFAKHSVMLTPMTVKNIVITTMIAAQPTIWIVTIARFAILAPIARLSTEKHF